jgi:pimeloyl-ACP methyl ester carboxylesterase
MQSLAAVLDDVRAGRRPPWPCHPNPSTISFPSQTRRLSEATAFGSNPGALRMLKFVPRGLRGSSPLVVLLHGCGQTAHDIDHGSGWSTLANEIGFALLVPEQRRSNNAQRGFNWFQPSDTKRGRGEALSIRQMVNSMIEDHGLDRRRVYITGLSAGGAMTCALLAAYPDVFRSMWEGLIQIERAIIIGIEKIAGQRLRLRNLTRENAGAFHGPGNRATETRLAG